MQGGADCEGLLRRFKSYVEESAGWRRVAIALFAGSVSVLAFAPFFASPVLFVTLPIFVWLVASSPDPKAAAVVSWWFAFGYFFFNLVWLGEAFLVEADKFAWLLPFAVTLLPAGLSFFWAGAGWLLKRMNFHGVAGVVAFAAVVSAVEWLRGHLFTGLPWDVPGYALTAPLVLMQGAGLFGIYGLTLIACLVFAAPFVLLMDEPAAGVQPSSGPRPLVTIALLTGVPLVTLFGYGSWRLSMPVRAVPGVNMRIVQPSVPQREKWLAQYQRRIFDDHLLLSRTNAAGEIDDLRSTTHVIWPESAMPFFPLEVPKALSEIATMLPKGSVLITGVTRREPKAEARSGDAAAFKNWKVFNSIVALDDGAKTLAVYDKIHLVPFGEYLPFDSVLGALGLKKLTHGRGSFTPGPSPRPLMNIPGLPPVTGLICYEAVFPNEVVETAERPKAIVNVTNDGWFGNSTGPRQHFHQTRIRSVEQGVPVVRAANNGISAIVDPFGRVVRSLGMNVHGVIDGPLPQAVGAPPYAFLGEWIFAALEGIAGLFLVFFARRRSR